MITAPIDEVFDDQVMLQRVQARTQSDRWLLQDSPKP